VAGNWFNLGLRKSSSGKQKSTPRSRNSEQKCVVNIYFPKFTRGKKFIEKGEKTDDFFLFIPQRNFSTKLTLFYIPMIDFGISASIWQ
jgi:hypothetical protein